MSTSTLERPVDSVSFFDTVSGKHRDIPGLAAPKTPREILKAAEVQEREGARFVADGEEIALDTPLTQLPEEATYVTPVVGG